MLNISSLNQEYIKSKLASNNNTKLSNVNNIQNQHNEAGKSKKTLSFKGKGAIILSGICFLGTIILFAKNQKLNSKLKELLNQTFQKPASSQNCIDNLDEAIQSKISSMQEESKRAIDNMQECTNKIQEKLQEGINLIEEKVQSGIERISKKGTQEAGTIIDATQESIKNIGTLAQNSITSISDSTQEGIDLISKAGIDVHNAVQKGLEDISNTQTLFMEKLKSAPVATNNEPVISTSAKKLFLNSAQEFQQSGTVKANRIQLLKEKLGNVTTFEDITFAKDSKLALLKQDNSLYTGSVFSLSKAGETIEVIYQDGKLVSSKIADIFKEYSTKTNPNGSTISKVKISNGSDLSCARINIKSPKKAGKSSDFLSSKCLIDEKNKLKREIYSLSKTQDGVHQIKTQEALLCELLKSKLPNSKKTQEIFDFNKKLLSSIKEKSEEFICDLGDGYDSNGTFLKTKPLSTKGSHRPYLLDKTDPKGKRIIKFKEIFTIDDIDFKNGKAHHKDGSIFSGTIIGKNKNGRFEIEYKDGLIQSSTIGDISKEYSRTQNKNKLIRKVTSQKQDSNFTKEYTTVTDIDKNSKPFLGILRLKDNKNLLTRDMLRFEKTPEGIALYKDSRFNNPTGIFKSYGMQGPLLQENQEILNNSKITYTNNSQNFVTTGKMGESVCDEGVYLKSNPTIQFFSSDGSKNNPNANQYFSILHNKTDEEGYRALRFIKK